MPAGVAAVAEQHGTSLSGDINESADLACLVLLRVVCQNGVLVEVDVGIVAGRTVLNMLSDGLLITAFQEQAARAEQLLDSEDNPTSVRLHRVGGLAAQVDQVSDFEALELRLEVARASVRVAQRVAVLGNGQVVERHGHSLFEQQGAISQDLRAEQG